MGENQKNNFQKILIIAASALLIVYIIYQAYMLIYNPVKTELAYEYTLEDSINTDVLVVREESYIVNKKKGTIVPAVDDGSRVAKDQPVAYVFTETETADNFQKLRDLEKQIERYEKLANQSNNYIFDVSDLDNYIDEETISFVNMIDNREFSALDDEVNEFRNQVVTKQISTGGNFDFDSKLASYKAQYEKLSKKSTKHKNIISTSSGYYINGTDGYESVVDFSTVLKINVNDIRKAFEADATAVPEGSIGKVVTDFTWYFLCVVDMNKIPGLSVGKKITVNLPYSAVTSAKATVAAINEDRNTGEAALILACNLMDPDMALLRHESAELVISSHTGIKIPTSALRVDEDGNKGVYVLSGNIAKFKQVNIIYSTDDYVLSKAEEGSSGFVTLYDNIITEGKELYDGKVVK
ncbi:MAG: hypothetical protein KBS43_00420 [Oscillospiraceae bacterium]|nr:hypothetical protein [Candidatus Limimonas coprohippi]MCQ2487661.1 hypothetical protein [Clostridia bacterium]